MLAKNQLKDESSSKFQIVFGQVKNKQTAQDEDVVKLTFHRRNYEFNLTQQKTNGELIQCIKMMKPLFKLLAEKEARSKLEVIEKVAPYYHYSLLEYYLHVAQFKIYQAQKEKSKKEHSRESFDQNIEKYFILYRVDENSKKAETECEETCCICQCEMYDDIDKTEFDVMQMQLMLDADSDAIGLVDCDGHYFHQECMKQMVSSSHVKCPVCSKIYGVVVGSQPPGTMTESVQNFSCAGYEGCKTIVINYSMPSANINGKHIPGTGRTAYLPDNQEGREVRDLLRLAFQRKLIFTVGRSVTTGMDNQIVWNGIHHKTSTSGGSSHFGYPDPTYFTRVKEELAQKGIR